MAGRQDCRNSILQILPSCLSAILQFTRPASRVRVYGYKASLMTSRSFFLLFGAGAALLVTSACSAPKPEPPAASAVKPNVAAEFRTTATIKDIMDSIIDPSADYLWDSVATIVTRKGVEEKRPRTPEEWKEVRRRAIAMIEGTNLLIMDGRKVAHPGEKSENPGIELGPEEIQMLIDADRQTLIVRAHALHDAGMKALAAIDKKDVDGLSDAGEAIDEACEQCHLKYWYPPDTPEILKKASVRKAPL
jgi:hypothetical protein